MLTLFSRILIALVLFLTPFRATATIAAAKTGVILTNVEYRLNSPKQGDFTLEFDMVASGYAKKSLIVDVSAAYASTKLPIVTTIKGADGKPKTDILHTRTVVTPPNDNATYKDFKLTLPAAYFPDETFKWVPLLLVQYESRRLYSDYLSPAVQHSSSKPVITLTPTRTPIPVVDISKKFSLTINSMKVFDSNDFFGDELYIVGNFTWQDGQGKYHVCNFSTGRLTKNLTNGKVTINQTPCGTIRSNGHVQVYLEIKDQDSLAKPIKAAAVDQDYNSICKNQSCRDYLFNFSYKVNGVIPDPKVGLDVKAASDLGNSLLKAYFNGLYSAFDSDDKLYTGYFLFPYSIDTSVEFGCREDDDIIFKDAESRANFEYGFAAYRVHCTSKWEHQYTTITAEWN